MPTPVIIDAIRTPIGALGGVLAPVRPDDLAALVLKAIINRNKLDPALVEIDATQAHTDQLRDPHTRRI